jgi:2-dehydro-3-deoxyphosphogluconate aldolase/(4S)-4-hydroxy-2-oxoglutarate aldolase
MNMREILALSPVIPVLTVSELEHAVPLARALIGGGMRVLEITLRTAVATGCIEAIRKALPDALIGAGDLARPADFAAAGRAGAQFGVSPGLTAELAAAARGARFPLLPGAMTPTEIIAARMAGFNVLNSFRRSSRAGSRCCACSARAFPMFCSAPPAASRLRAQRITWR